MKKKPTLNVRLLRRIQKQILKEPRQFNMNYFFSEFDTFGNEKVPNCGTAACIAGWAIALSNKKNPASACAKFGSSYYGSIDRGGAALGLTEEERVGVFFDDDWPEPFRAKFKAAATSLAKARVAARYIDHFIKEHGK